MENFFIDDNFYSEVEDYLEDAELYDKEGVQGLPDDWKERVELAQEEKIFQITEQWVVNAIAEKAQNENEDRFPEDPDRVDGIIKRAIIQSVDWQKINALIPTMYYPSGKFEDLTKQDLLDAL